MIIKNEPSFRSSAYNLAHSFLYKCNGEEMFKNGGLPFQIWAIPFPF